MKWVHAEFFHELGGHPRVVVEPCSEFDHRHILPYNKHFVQHSLPTKESVS